MITFIVIVIFFFYFNYEYILNRIEMINNHIIYHYIGIQIIVVVTLCFKISKFCSNFFRIAYLNTKHSYVST